MSDKTAKRHRDWKVFVRGMKLTHTLQPFTILCTLIGSLFQALFPFTVLYLSSEIITQLGREQRDWKQIVTIVIATIIVSVLNFLITGFFNQMTDILCYVLEHKKELHLADKGYQLDYLDMEDATIRENRERLRNSGFQSGLVENVMSVKEIVAYTLAMAFSVTLVLRMFLAQSSKDTLWAQLTNSPLLAVLLCLFLFLSIYYTAKTSALLQKKEFEVMDHIKVDLNYNYYYGFQLSQEYNYGKNIRLYQEQDLISKEITSHWDHILKFRKRLASLTKRYWTIGSILSSCLTLLCFLYVGMKAMSGAIGIGDIVLYTGAVAQFSENFSGFARTLAKMKQNSEFMQWSFDFLDLPNQKETGNLPISLEEAKGCEIEFRNVSFRYPGASEDTLKHINVTFHPGERVAIVGKNGSGKTTFIKLLCRLYDPQEGEILLNGVNIKDYNYYDYLSAFSVVFQDFHLFSFTLGENVACASDYDENKALTCVQEAGLGDRMSRFTEGVKTQLYNEFAEEGVEISGGEAQKIAIARALYKDAPFIVLDEPTAALDPIAESDIYSRLNDMIQDKSAIYISHRLSSCKFCNQIAVFDNGSLVQYGTHNKLLENTEGLYHELWNAQAKYYQ